MGERNSAIAALKFFAARAAKGNGRISAPVKQHHNLLPAIKTLFDF
jgi:hypothetical protein